MRCLKTQQPGFKIHYATKSQYKNLLINNPYIDKIHVLNDSLMDLIDELRQEKFDLIIDLHNNLRTVNIWSQLRVKRYKFDKINWEKWLMVRLKVNMLPYHHIVDRYLETVESLGIKNDGKGLDYFISDKANLNDFDILNDYVVYAIGAHHNTKKLPYTKQVEMCMSINKPIYLIGGKEDAADGEALSKACDNTINMCGKLSIDQSALLMKGANKVYSHDTGMMHIAAALQKPIVSIWGNTIPDFGMYPYYPTDFDDSVSVELEVQDLGCRPCSKIGYNKCPKGHFKCMMNQSFTNLH